MPFFAVSNAGPEKVDVWAGTEFSVNAIDFGWSLRKTLEPGERAVFPIVPTKTYPQSRPVLQCYKFYTKDIRGRANRFIDSGLLKRQTAGRIYVTEETK